jgi:hypothetical protein
MTNLQEALFPPIEEEEETSFSEKVIFDLFDEIKARPRPGLAITAAVLVEQEIDMWKQRIADLESLAETRPTPPPPPPLPPPPAVILADDDGDGTVVTHDEEEEEPQHRVVSDGEVLHLPVDEEDSSAD